VDNLVKNNTNQSSEGISYLAGVVDEEGCFYIGRVTREKYGNGFQWHCMLKFTRSDEELISWLKKTFGESKGHH